MAFLRFTPRARIIAVATAVACLLSACAPFTARVEGGSESKPRWEIGVQF